MSQMHAGLAICCVAPVGCANHEDYIDDLRTAEDHADVSLHEAIVLAEAADGSAEATHAALLVDGSPRYWVCARSADGTSHFHVTLRGTVQAAHTDAAFDGRRSASIPLVEALAIAEDEVQGTAVAIAPDDVLSDAFEIRVLTPFALWQVLVSSRGEVLRCEECND